MINKYKYEITIAIVGGIISMIELFLDVKLGYFIIALTILLDISLIGMRTYMKDCLREYSEFHDLAYDIDNKYWSDLAEKELSCAKERLYQLKRGEREVRADELTFEELRLIKQADKYMYCTYYADSLIKLKLRSARMLKYNPMAAVNVVYKDLGQKKICKKRVFVLDKIDASDTETQMVLEEIENYYSSAEIGFTNRYIYYSKLREMKIEYFGNIVLVDGQECTLCTDNTQYPDDYFERDRNIVREIHASNVIDHKTLEAYKLNFEKIWEIALPYADFL